MYMDRGCSGAHSHSKIRAQKYFPNLLIIVQKLKNVQKIGSWPKNRWVGREIMWVAQENYIAQMSAHHSTHESEIKIQEKYYPELLKIVKTENLQKFNKMYYFQLFLYFYIVFPRESQVISYIKIFLSSPRARICRKTGEKTFT